MGFSIPWSEIISSLDSSRCLPVDFVGSSNTTTRGANVAEDIHNVVSETDMTYANLHQYVYALPVSSLCSGCDTIQKLEENVGVLQNLKKLSNADMERLVDTAKPYAGKYVENYKRVFGWLVLFVDFREIVNNPGCTLTNRCISLKHIETLCGHFNFVDNLSIFFF